jgi:peptidyl-dipeptidase Dcp
MPDDMLAKLLAARNVNQGFLTVEYLASAYVDMDFHANGAASDAAAVERATLDRIGMPEAILMRHRPTHFGHIFAGEAYAAGYYSYLWSEVLDADGFDAFVEAGDIFDAATARRLRDYVYAAGYLRDPAEAYIAFRGRLPQPEALLRKRGFLEAPTGDA